MLYPASEEKDNKKSLKLCLKNVLLLLLSYFW